MSTLIATPDFKHITERSGPRSSEAFALRISPLPGEMMLQLLSLARFVQTYQRRRASQLLSDRADKIPVPPSAHARSDGFAAGALQLPVLMKPCAAETVSNAPAKWLLPYMHSSSSCISSDRRRKKTQRWSWSLRVEHWRPQKQLDKYCYASESVPLPPVAVKAELIACALRLCQRPRARV